MRLWRPRSLALRVTAIVAAVVLASSAAGFSLAHVAAIRLMQRQLDAEIAAEAATLEAEYRLFGAAGLRAAVEAQALRSGPGGFALRLTQPGAEPIFAGRPFTAPTGLIGIHNLEQPPRPVRVLGVALGDGNALVVAASLRGLRRTARGLAGIFLAAGALTAGLTVLAGLLLARGAERRLLALSAAAEAVMQGDLSRRLPLAGSADEMDRLAAAMNRMLARIEALMTALRQVTNDIAHDLRGPLSRLRQQLEGRLAASREPRADAAALEAALVELDAVLATFAGLLRIAQIEAGARRAGFAPLDLSSLVADMAETFGPVAEDAGAALHADITTGLRIQGDAALLRQLLANLIENALTHGGRALRLSLRAGPVLEVADDGLGIPAAEREAVLGRFYRLDRSRGTPGSGLGLALVSAVARLHGAELALRDAEPGLSPPGLSPPGLLVRIDFAAADQRSSAPPSSPSPNTPAAIDTVPHQRSGVNPPAKANSAPSR